VDLNRWPTVCTAVVMLTVAVTKCCVYAAIVRSGVVKSALYLAEVMDGWETRFMNCGNVIRHRECRIKDDNNITCWWSWCNDGVNGVRWHEKTWVGDFGKLSSKTSEEKHRFGLIKRHKINRHPLRDKINCGFEYNYDRKLQTLSAAAPKTLLNSHLIYVNVERGGSEHLCIHVWLA